MHPRVINCRKENLIKKMFIFYLSTKSCIHKIIYKTLVVAARLGALLDVLGLALGLEHLLGLLLLDVAALLPGDRGALPGGGVALLLVHELGDGGGHVAAHLLGDVVTHLAGGGHVVAHLYFKLNIDDRRKCQDFR